MTGCCVLGCNNSSEKGFSLRRFPSDAKRRTMWIIKIGRKDWKPSPYSHICEVHFAEDMWEKLRIDGKKKLKHNAVPTIFPTIQKEKSKANFNTVNHSQETEISIQNNPNELEVINVNYSQETEIGIQNNPNEIEVMNDSNHSNVASVTPEISIDKSISESPVLQIDLKKKLKAANEKLQIANRIICKHEKTKKNLLHQIRKLKSQRRLRIEKNLLKSSETLHKVFNNDQIEWLQKDSSTRKVYKWSENTIKKALRLKFSCTNNGYKELIRQNIPLPSTRTLRRSIETLNFQPGIFDDIFVIFKDKVSQFKNEKERDCMLALDEISLTPGEQIDTSTNFPIGYATIPNSHGEKPLATHALVFMLGGIFTRWKQIVAFHYTWWL